MDKEMSLEEARSLLDARLKDSIYMSGVTAGWNAAQSADPKAALAQIEDAHSRSLAENNDDLKRARALLAAKRG